MKKALVIGLGGQGKKYLEFFKKKGYLINGICKSLSTKEEIERLFGIDVFLEEEKIDYEEYDVIAIALPLSIQGKKTLEICSLNNRSKIIVEIPVTFERDEMQSMLGYDNLFFFVEERFTLLSSFLGKADMNAINEIRTNLWIGKEELQDPEAVKVGYLHLLNNFYGLDIENRIRINISGHEVQDIFYDIGFGYKGKDIRYVFKDNEKYLQIDDKRFDDPYNFDNVLSKILEMDKMDKSHYLKLHDFLENKR